MEIVVITDSPAEGKALSTAIASQGHTAVWRIGIAEGKKEVTRRLWEIDAIICSLGSRGVPDLALLAEYVDYLKDQRGYNHKPYFVGISNEIPRPVAVRIQVTGGFAIAGNTDITKLLGFLEIFANEVSQEFYRPYILLEHGYAEHQNLFCDEEEKLLGVSVGYLGPPIATEQSTRTAVLIDYLCRQKYAKTEAEICAGIAADRFYRAHLAGICLRQTAIKMLICRTRKRLAPALAQTKSGIRAHQLISNIPGHTRKYKINAVVKVIHRKIE